MGRLLSPKYEFGFPVGARNLPKFENRDFRWLLTLGMFRVSKTSFRFFVIFAIFGFWKVTDPNCGSKFMLLSKEPNRLLGFVIIRLGARVIKKKFQDLGKSGPPHRGPLTGAP